MSLPQHGSPSQISIEFEPHSRPPHGRCHFFAPLAGASVLSVCRQSVLVFSQSVTLTSAPPSAGEGPFLPPRCSAADLPRSATLPLLPGPPCGQSSSAHTQPQSAPSSPGPPSQVAPSSSTEHPPPSTILASRTQHHPLTQRTQSTVSSLWSPSHRVSLMSVEAYTICCS
ncbi:cell wall protein RBR3-like [Arachis ipaensis]|uniref:cell wall protein RBR3-like n=1 Tax=Arachis ipaensis TaxID=130454 RepID=UPI000A2B5D47|nr:cell wall protein RBR3-like [Arachis ipaensis]